MAVTIVHAETLHQIDAARKLFREYEAWLGIDLCFQGFETELANLPGKYARAPGRLLLAYDDRKLAGCVAMRKFNDEICEMKRLYVRGRFRGRNIGNLLIEHLIDEAKSAGYDRMRLDTFPAKMAKAVRLYESHGFVQIEPYYANPNDGVLFMEMSL